MKAGDIVIAPHGCAECLTPEKEYKVIQLWDVCFPEHRGNGFYILDDNNVKIPCNEKKSSHLNGQDWIIK